MTDSTERATDPPPKALAAAQQALGCATRCKAPAGECIHRLDIDVARALDAFCREGVDPYAAALREIALLPFCSKNARNIAMRALNWSQLP